MTSKGRRGAAAVEGKGRGVIAMGVASGSTGAGWTSRNDDEAAVPGVEATGVDTGVGDGVTAGVTAGVTGVGDAPARRDG